MATLGWVVFGGAAIVLVAIVRGLLLQQLWAWFVAPTFGLPHLRLVEAIGLSIVVGFLTAELNEDEEDMTGERFLRRFLKALVYYLVVWIMAAVVHAFA